MTLQNFLYALCALCGQEIHHDPLLTIYSSYANIQAAKFSCGFFFERNFKCQL